MASIINSDNGVVSGSVGLKYASDNSGVLALQTNGNTAVTIDSSGNMGVGGTPAISTYAGVHIQETYPVVKLTSASTGHTSSDGFEVRIDSTPRGEIWMRENAPIAFGTNNTERLIIPADSAGIKFPATQAASSDANTLDDYEEGNWTPVITNLTNNVSAYYWQSGVYRKIGNMVWIEAQLSVQTVGSVTGNLYITGLPFSLAQKSGLGSQSKTIVYGTKYAGSAQGAIAMIIESSAPTQFQAFWASDISSWIQGSTLTPGGQWHFQGCYVATA